MGWLEQHLETFVKPVLGISPTPIQAFTPAELTVMKNFWRSAKRAAGDLPMLLAGRDVWLFEVLARRENYPTTFRPDISRLSVSHVTEDYSKYFLLDTGFLGTIPARLGIPAYKLASGKNQIFPKLTGSRSLVLKIESQPKYWETATVREGQIVQRVTSDLDMFAKAVGITIAVYTNSAPKFINVSQPIPIHHRGPLEEL